MRYISVNMYMCMHFSASHQQRSSRSKNVKSETVIYQKANSNSERWKNGSGMFALRINETLATFVGKLECGTTQSPPNFDLGRPTVISVPKHQTIFSLLTFCKMHAQTHTRARAVAGTAHVFHWNSTPQKAFWSANMKWGFTATVHVHMCVCVCTSYKSKCRKKLT